MKKWNVGLAAAIGALAGILISIVGPMVTGGMLPSDPAELLGNLGIGAILVGALAGIGAAVRNSRIKA